MLRDLRARARFLAAPRAAAGAQPLLLIVVTFFLVGAVKKGSSRSRTPACLGTHQCERRRVVRRHGAAPAPHHATCCWRIRRSKRRLAPRRRTRSGGSGQLYVELKPLGEGRSESTFAVMARLSAKAGELSGHPAAPAPGAGSAERWRRRRRRGRAVSGRAARATISPDCRTGCRNCVGAEEDPAAARRRQRHRRSRHAPEDRHRSRHRVAPRRQSSPRSTARSTTRSASARSRRSIPTSTSSRSSSARCRTRPRARRRSTTSTCARQRGAMVPISAFAHKDTGSRRRGPSRVPVPDDGPQLQPRARRSDGPGRS